MAGIGGMLAGAVLKVAAAPAGDWIMLQWRFRENLEHMRRTLESIEAALKDAERRSIEEEKVRLWLQRLTQASYDISDLIDEFEVNTTRKSSLRKFKARIDMASKIKKVREKLDKIKSDHDAFGFMTSSNSHLQLPAADDRETTWEIPSEANILGRDQEKKKLIHLLVKASISSDFVVLPIYGIGGIGKTTLAQLLFNDTHFTTYEKAWVYVSQIFDKKKIKGDITSQLGKEQRNQTDIQESTAASKKILIVLDDLWEKDDSKLGNLMEFLERVGNDGHKVTVIVTTRDAGIANKVQTIGAHSIEALSVDVCWDIIKQKASFEKRFDKERFEVVGKKIAGKCGGVALAARAIGYVLRFRSDLPDWVSVEESGIWNASTSGSSPDDNVPASLKISYSSMPSDLRSCFVYCAIFPKGHIMAKDELIYQWAALGFIMPCDGISIQQHGERCIKQLLEMCFLQHSASPSTGSKDGVTYFTMHDLVHDLARSVMGDELLDASRAEFKKFEGRNCRYAFLADCSKPLNSYVTYPDKIRALRFLRSGETGYCCSIGFSTTKYIRVLDLGESSLKKLLPSIGQLKMLRYLNAPRIKDQVIPSCITKLSKLMYLNLHGSNEFSTLPESFGKMEALMYLDLSCCYKIKKLPESFGKLGSLIHLDLSDCRHLNGIPEALCSLTTLQHLNLSWCDCLPSGSKGLHEVIGKLTKLRYLNLSSSLNSFYYRERDHEETLKINDSVLDKISTLSNLEHLDISNGRFVRLPDSFCSLRKLQTLDLTDCRFLKKLPTDMNHMESLKFLIGCGSLTIPINKCLIPLPKFMVHVEGEQSSNLIRLKDVNPTKLEISCLENVKSTEEARKIELRGKQSLKNLTLVWTRGTNGYVEDMELLRELVPPSSLERFQLRGSNSVSCPAWLKATAIYLPNLVSVKLKGLSRCSSLPSLGELPNLKYLDLEAMPSITKIDRAFCGDRMKAFPLLERLTISDMENLEEWTTTYSCGESVADEFMFPNLQNLSIAQCPKLRVEPCPPRVKNTWWVADSDRVLSQWEEAVPHTVCSTSSAPVVHTLWVESCLAPMDQWMLLHHLPGLQVLGIKKCNDLSSSPEVIRALTSLTSLYFSYCASIQELPQWLGDLTSLQSLYLDDCPGIQALPEQLGDCVSLKELSIKYCNGITSLPESIRTLASLESLTVWGCPELRNWCELEENKTKIDHVLVEYPRFATEQIYINW